MKNTVRILVLTAGIVIAAIAASQAQNKVDEQRMDRDIAVAQNVLSTMIKQQFSRRNFFPMEVEASYLPGFGVTFRIPMEIAGTMIYMIDDNPRITMNRGAGSSFSYNFSSGGNDAASSDECEDCAKVKGINGSYTKVAPRAKKSAPALVNADSLSNAYNDKILQAAKEFLADYGDMLSQLSPEERIVITNRADGSQRNLFWKSDAPQTYMSLEVIKSDLTQFKQGKLSHDQFMQKIKVVNSETTDELSPDLELLSSIFNRLYQYDLSKTFYIQEEVYYERLKDYGAIFDMHVYSSNGVDMKHYDMPTLGLRDVDRNERDKKVKELYPLFEKSILEDVLEYGKTLKSLKDNEMLIFNIRMTECKGCNIPTSLEISFKNSVLRDYSAGKISKEAALTKASLKKGPNQ